jgi:1-acyl-sn-glycerol-3-phosphate acyltransferase
MLRVGLRRDAWLLVDDWLGGFPLVGPALARAGAVRGGTAALRRLLARDEAVVVAPEPAPAKLFRDRYRLARFGRAGFARIAIETGTPIVPVGVIGAEEIHPVLARIDLAGRALGLPTLPITPTFPWLGLAGLVPLPTKWILMIGEPLDVAARHAPADARQPAAVARLRDQVRERLQALVLEGLRRRRSVFRG